MNLFCKASFSIKRVSVVLFFFIGLSESFGQVEFEKGYFINQSDQRVECMIKNANWLNNPSIVKYKLNDTSEELDITPETAKEFQVYGYPKYVLAKVDIDRSPTELSELTTDKRPIWSSEKLFLKIVIEGKATLLKYESANFVRFFYSVDGSPFKQLVYKEYWLEARSLGQNNTFQQQLLNEVNCGGIEVAQVKNVKYKETELVKYFKKYNVCNGEVTVEETGAKDTKSIRDVVNFKIAPGFNYTSLSVLSSVYSDIDYNKEWSPRVGLETEFVLPFNKNKLSFLIEPVYQSYKANSTSGSGSVELNTIDFQVGVRYYFFLSKTNKLFVNAHIVPYSIVMNSSLKITDYSELEIKLLNNLSFGAGMEADRFSFEFRYYLKRDIIGGYAYRSSDLSTLSFIMGYKFLKIQSKKQG